VKDGTYADQTVTLPQSAYKIGAYKLTTDATHNYKINLIGLALYTTQDSILSDIYLTYGGNISGMATSGQDTLLFEASTTVPSNSTIDIAVYATLTSSAPLSPGDVVVTHLLVDGTELDTGNRIESGEEIGQTITVGTKLISAVMDASTPASALVVANSLPKVGSFKFTGLNDSYTITQMIANVATTSDATAVVDLVFKDGATVLGTQSLIGNVATMTGLTILVPYFSNGTKVIDVYADVGSIGGGVGNTGANVGVTLTSFTALGSDNSTTTVSTNLSGSNFYAHKTKPTLHNVALPSTVLAVGTQTIGRINITADAGGTVAWRKIVCNYSMSGSFNIDSIAIYDDADQVTPLGGVIVSTTSSTITVTSSLDQEVAGSKTYDLKATITGSVSNGDSLSTNVPSGVVAHSLPTTYANTRSGASLIWSDESESGHSDATSDWMDDFLVKNLPLDVQTMTK
jgi:hypothetical protein